MTETGHCKHGEFILTEGCPQCVADRMAEEGNTESSIAEAVKKADRQIVKVQYYSQTTGEISDREYTYFSADRLSVGDVLMVPVRDTTAKAIVNAIDVSPAEIINFADKVKTIPAGSVIPPEPELFTLPEPEQEEMEAGFNEEWLTLVTPSPEPETAITLRPGEDIEAHGYFDEAMKLLEYAEARVIKTLDDVKAANNDLIPISKLKKVMGEKRKEYLEPLREKADAIRATYDFLMAPVLEADKITRDKMLSFEKEQRRIRAEEEEINRKRMEAAQAEMKLKGELTEPVNLVEVTPEAPKRVRTIQGLSSYTDCWKYEVVDFTLLDDAYKVEDGPLLTSTAKKHHDKKPIPGVRFYNDPIISVRG